MSASAMSCFGANRAQVGRAAEPAGFLLPPLLAQPVDRRLVTRLKRARAR
jgi:hypothetical protein